MSEPGTFIFADLAGFTALTEAHGDEDAADLAADFFQSVRTLLPEYGATEIKAMGDELMIRAEDAGAAIRLALCIV
jgi:adenylate cyclase